jgi:hypothetical protein
VLIKDTIKDRWTVNVGEREQRDLKEVLWKMKKEVLVIDPQVEKEFHRESR